jgi:dTMP kinase
VSAGSGVFISFEGGEGAGKSTQAKRLAETLRQAGHEVVLTREPGGTPGAEAIRALLLDPNTLLTPLADTLLHFAARADHVANIIAPALARGAIVICDRFFDSTLAYQGYGMGVDLADIRNLIALINLKPDLTFILELPDSIAKTRLTQRGGNADRYERMDPAIMARIAQGFREIAAAEPQRCLHIDASGDIDAVFSSVLNAVRSRLHLP